MGWSIGFDSNWNRDIGYGVPAACDHPNCSAEIDRGLSYVCGGEPYGGEHGCGLFFCDKHLFFTEKNIFLCDRCNEEKPAFEAKPDVAEWIKHKLAHSSWKEWRDENPKELEKLNLILREEKVAI